MLVFDSAEPGFGLRVTADGKRVFLFQYRAEGVVRRHRIGVWGGGEDGLTTSAARKEAKKLRGQVLSGGDPVGEGRARKQAAKATARADRERQTVEAFTFAKLVNSWKTKGVAHRRESYVDDATARLLRYFAGWLTRPAASITKAEVVLALDRIEQEHGTTSSRRALAYARAAYGWACKRDMLEVNPFGSVAAPGKENPRDRVLTDAEVGAIWTAAAAMGNVGGSYVRVLLLTLQRLEEVGGMMWSEIAPDRTTWTIPAERAKNGRAHLVHLAPAVQDILAALPRMKGNPHVFPGRGKGSIGGFSHLKKELVRVMSGTPPVQKGRRRATRPRVAETPDWRFHDFRRTGVTTLANQGIPPHVADKLLNHVTGAIQGVAAVYQRAEFMTERKRASEAWAAHVLTCAGKGVAGNVVQLPQRQVAGG